MTKKRYKLRVRKKEVILALLILIGFISIYFGYKIYLQHFAPIKSVNYHGIPLEFRTDLREANKIPVYPNEKALNIFYNPKIRKVYIVFRNTTQNSLVEVEAWEIAFKLKTFYNLLRWPVEIKGANVTSYSQAKGNSTYPVIVLIPPVDANSTYVNVSNYTVFISGTDLHHFDLATNKFLMTVLGIKV